MPDKEKKRIELNSPFNAATNKEEFVDLLHDHLQINELSAQLMEPHVVTVRLEDGAYRKRPMIGGEMVAVSGAYLGKRGKIIFTGVIQDNAGETRPAEFSNKELRTLFPTMNAALRDNILGYFPETIIACFDEDRVKWVRSRPKISDLVEKKEVDPFQIPEYGTW